MALVWLPDGQKLNLQLVAEGYPLPVDLLPNVAAMELPGSRTPTVVYLDAIQSAFGAAVEQVRFRPAEKTRQPGLTKRCWVKFTIV